MDCRKTFCRLFPILVLAVSITMASQSQSLVDFLDMNRILRHYLNDRLQLSKEYSKKAIEEIEPIVKSVLEKVKNKDERFDMEIKYRGSYYERVKIKEADEFDIDLCIKSLEVEALPSGRPANTTAEYTLYKLEGANIERWKNLASKDGKHLSAQAVVAAYSNLVKQAVDAINQEEETTFFVKSKTNHPAITLELFETLDGTKDAKECKPKYSVDLAPVIKVKKWPVKLTKGWQNRAQKGWPSPDIINTLVEKTPVYLVPKLYKNTEHEQRPLLWRYAFNEGEKKLLLESDSGNSNNCRRNVLRVLKGFLIDFGWNLGVRSYHMKTILLHESEKYPNDEDWAEKKLKERIISAIRRFKSFISGDKCILKHYFIPDINLFAGLTDEFKTQIVKKIDIFLDKPEACLLWCMYVLNNPVSKVCAKI